MKKVIAGLALCALLSPAAVLAANPTTANVSVGSVYYSYIDKLSAMGYLKSMPNGARPYSRMQMARWTVEAEETAAEKPMPAYLEDQLAALETYLAPEIETIKGNPQKDEFRLRSVGAELSYNHADYFDYDYSLVRPINLNGSWAPFGANRNGHKYGRNTNLYANAEVSGNIAPELAVSIKFRAGWDKDNDGNASLEEAYVKTRLGSIAFEAGRQAMTWGQGESGHLLLGNNMKPLTTIQAHLANPVKVGGFFKFLGEVDVHAFYGFLDKDRGSDAAARGHKDYDDAKLVGLRLDVTPTDWMTLGASRVSMLGGKGNAFHSSDLGDWAFGKNADYGYDKWDDIGGFDFRLRFPAFEVYGEMMGEDQAGGLPSKWAYRGGVYLPRLTKDGSWDLTVEAAKTTDVWYRHSTYQSGWTYSGDIMGDDMGNDSRKVYARLKHYLPGERMLGFYYQRTDRQRNAKNNPVVNEIGLLGQMKLRGDVYLGGMLGYAKVKNQYTENVTFAGVNLDYRF